ncbi:hypothetical protein CLAFUW4_05208 [Fulvia fulva]|uniref:Uncharacterized protein n=1 Tax=Passalora fulva TaxID=5499 RepID=A0A9Q8PI59_PASFU|nr:uncharacterized protein CLAFUR5_11698 [Fulvia fulva]KAK4626923.1 hypothetical protein CLAFUR4_05194 [Fulvia fulva]KAK4628598.1 hypothetical protein CLAFUR0_05200 [Fulvia fulva]UJO22918.1 hypothetical protein CLAFUR5_11698 [Fulvia fulva]WPV13262.1 hypothetical protein CLAFUW4_05208 [Fulvia fulva]WPV28461.1 hypothetical protein CLAFUW7_05204 [Fulvia fulva]
MRSRVTDFVLEHGRPSAAPFTYLRIACHLRSEALYKNSIAAAMVNYERLVVDYNAPGIYGVQKPYPQQRLIQELGGNEELAMRVMAAHRTYKDMLQTLDSELENLNPAVRLPRGLTITKTRLYTLSANIFHAWYDQRRHAWYNTKRRDQVLRNRFRQNVYSTLVRGKVDVRSIVGHWKAQNKQWRTRLPRGTTIQGLVHAVQECFEHAGSLAMQLFDEDMVYRGPDQRGQWQEVPLCEISNDYVYPWQEDGERQQECISRYPRHISRSNLSVVMEEPSMGDDRL